MATIREISDRAGVSIATVSKVLNNKSGVKQETADRILQIADQLNYRPNLNARSLKLGDARTIGIITTVMMFLAPVFYPITAIPEEFRSWLLANPLTFIIEQAREVLIWGNSPDWVGLGIYLLVASVVAWAGYAWFQKTRKGFADVI